MFRIRGRIRLLFAGFLVFFVVSFWYLSKAEIVATADTPAHRLAVIVPFRNRSSELEIFVPHMSTYLHAQSIEHVFVIVNQVDSHRFNRAALINIGFLESRSSADYIVMHDIDLLPLNNRELRYDYPDKGPVHLASPRYHPIYRYSTYAGGILMITSADFERVNGMSPVYWGWGREDDNFYARMKIARMKIFRPTNLSTNSSNTFAHIHDAVDHQRDSAKYGNQTEEGRKINPQLGLNTTKYTVVNRSLRETKTGVQYHLIDVNIVCDYDLTPWCDHLTSTPT